MFKKWNNKENDSDFVSFFHDIQIPVRMDEVRKSIHYIRDNWSNENWREDMLKKAYQTFGLNIKEEFLIHKDWCDSDSNINYNNYELIRYYTSTDGYKRLKLLNDYFRKKDLSFEECNIATYLVELINIELYNFLYECPTYRNFERKIYRGFHPDKDDLKNVFHLIMDKDVINRSISIPLEFMSASFDRNRAAEYANGKHKKLPHNQVPFIMEITVRNLDKQLLDIYHSFYPDSPVTSLCAVPIERISDKPGEKEVLLRGAFFQVLNYYENEKPVRVETVMLNANRDHIKTQKYNGTNAQALFGSLVKQDKMRICKELSDNEQDRKAYEEAEQLAEQEVLKNIEISRKEQNK